MILRFLLSIVFVIICFFCAFHLTEAGTNYKGYIDSANTTDVIGMIYNLAMTFVFSLGGITTILLQILSQLHAVKKESTIEEY